MSLVLAVGFSLPAFSMVVGKVERAGGRVSILKRGSFRGVDYRRVNGKVEVGDVVRTKVRSFADVLFIDRSKAHLEESSRLIVEKYLPGKEVTLSSPMGKVVYRIVKSTKGAYRIKTPTALIGVKGTELATFVDSGISVVVVKEGTVEVVNPEFPRYRVTLKRNTATVVKPGRPPAKPIPVSKAFIQRVFKGPEREKPLKPSAEPKKGLPVGVPSAVESLSPTAPPSPVEERHKVEAYTEVVTQEVSQETTQAEETTQQEQVEEVITEATSVLFVESGKAVLEVELPPTGTPR